jgi:hypothetical protein
VQAAIVKGQMPNDNEIAKLVGLGERTVRGIRLWAGLNRWQVAAWIREREGMQSKPPEEVVLCTTPWAGLWLLVPLIAKSTLLAAARLLRWTKRTGIEAWSCVLTIVMWAVLGFRRYAHLDDFRHAADLGLALFTGRVRLLADSTMWSLIHTLHSKSAQAFYQKTAAEAVPLNVPQGEEWLSMDEHVVEFFTKLKPRPLSKTRVPTRGRSYPAIRQYAPFHLWAGRFVGLVITNAKRALSQVLPTLIAEVRQLRRQAEHPYPQRVDLILDRGAYKGALFEQLMADPNVRFIAMARATQKNVPQWEAVPEASFTAYQPEGEQNPNLQIAETTTVISDCRYPLRTVLIRDDTPQTKQRWRAMFAKVAIEELTPAEVDATYRRRQDHENSFAELDHHLAGKCLPKPYRLIREANQQGQMRKTVGTLFSAETMTGLRFVAWLRHWSYNLVKDFGAALGGRHTTMEVATLVRKFIARPGVLHLRGDQLLVSLTPFTGCDALTAWIRQINEQRLSIPWLGHLILQIEIASQPVGLAADPHAVRRMIFANSHSHFLA